MPFRTFGNFKKCCPPVRAVPRPESQLPGTERTVEGQYSNTRMCRKHRCGTVGTVKTGKSKPAKSLGEENQNVPVVPWRFKCVYPLDRRAGRFTSAAGAPRNYVKGLWPILFSWRLLLTCKSFTRGSH